MSLLQQLALICEQYPLIYSLLLLNFKAALIVAVALFCLLQMRHASAAQRHLVSALALASLVLLPLFSLVVPALEVAVLPAIENLSMKAEGRAELLPLSQNSPLSELAGYKLEAWLYGLLALYLLVLFLLLARLLLRLYRVRALIERGVCAPDGQLQARLNSLREQIGVQRGVEILLVEDIETPVTAGLLRPRIILPDSALSWRPETLDNCLLHELAHIRRYDWLTLTLGYLACALFWWNPVVWTLLRELRADSEYAADDQVINNGVRPSAYGEQLLALVHSKAEEHQNALLVGLAGQADISSRIRSLLDVRTNREPLKRAKVCLLAVFAFSCGGAVAAIETATLQQTGPLLKELLGRTGARLTLRYAGEEPTMAEAPVVESSHSSQISKPQFKVNHAPPAPPIEEVLVSAVMPEIPNAVNGLKRAELDIASPRTEVRVTGAVAVKSVTPVYPRSAMLAGQEGTVEVTFALSDKGEPRNIHIPGGSSSSSFKRAVMKALKASRFRPLMLNGQAVPSHGHTSRYHFRLLDKDGVTRNRDAPVAPDSS